MRFLIGCPVSDAYEVFMDGWLNSVGRFTKLYGWKVDILLADTSLGTKFFDRWSSKVPMKFLGVGELAPQRRIALGMNALTSRFLDGEYTYYLNLEIDIIAPPDTLVVLHSLITSTMSDVIFHDYPRKFGLGCMMGIGCALFSRPSLEDVDFGNCPLFLLPDSWYWCDVVEKGPLQTAKFHGFLKLEHRSDETNSLNYRNYWFSQEPSYQYDPLR